MTSFFFLLSTCVTLVLVFSYLIPQHVPPPTPPPDHRHLSPASSNKRQSLLKHRSSFLRQRSLPSERACVKLDC